MRPIRRNPLAGKKAADIIHMDDAGNTVIRNKNRRCDSNRSWGNFMKYVSARRLVVKAAFLLAGVGAIGVATAANATTYLVTFSGNMVTNAVPNPTDFPQLFTTGQAHFTVLYIADRAGT